MKPIKVEFWDDYIEEHPDFTGCLIDEDNDIAWYKEGKWHREDGPAIEYFSGEKDWYLNDIYYYSEQKYRIALRKLKLERVLRKIT